LNCGISIRLVKPLKSNIQLNLFDDSKIGIIKLEEIASKGSINKGFNMIDITAKAIIPVLDPE